MKVYLNLLALLFAAELSASAPNVLFISVDDLKPAISVYGDPHAITPQFERLAAQGTTFMNAHCQQAVCGPSRASVMTGLRPDQTRVWDLQTRIRDENPDVVTIPQHFQDNGYTAVGVGKIFDFRSVEGHERDDPASWSRPYEQFEKNPDSVFGILNSDFLSRVAQARAELGNVGWGKLKEAIGGVPPFEGTEDVDDEAYDDGQIALAGVRLIEELAPREEPFFIAVGFKKPHLPFVAPKHYWDLYERAQFEPDPRTERPEGSPYYHFQPGWELRNGTYSGVPPLSEPVGIPDETAIDLIHGYYACVSYIDAQIGKLLDALEASGEVDNTIIVLWSDHGFHLGDHGIWCKHTNYEQSTRVPLMIVDPRNPEVKLGGKPKVPVELVDIFATLCDLAGIEEPQGIEGTSLQLVMERPAKRIKPVAVSQFPRHFEGREIMGYSWRDERYRYIEWEDTQFRDGRSTGEILAFELYDYESDPSESRNLADDPEYAQILERLQRSAMVYKCIHRSDTVDFDLPESVDVANPSDAVNPAQGLGWREADEEIIYAQRPEGDLSLHVFKPDGWHPSDHRAALVAFHGGGWSSGDPRAFYKQAQYLTTRGMVVICPQYRIRNVHGTTPLESTQDAIRAMQYVRAHATNLGIDPSRIAAAGGSAGGHLAAATATVSGFESNDGELDGVSPRPNALLLFNPVLDTGPLGFGYWFLREEGIVISPIDQMEGEQPPTIIFNGDRDTTTTAERCLAFMEKMHRYGNRCEVVLYPDQFHSFFNPGYPENFADTLSRSRDFLDGLGYLD